MKECPECKQKNNDNDIYCMYCGAALNPQAEPSQTGPIQSIKSTYNRYEEQTKKASSNFKGAMKQANEAYLNNMQYARRNYEQKIEVYRQHLADIANVLGLSVTEWSDSAWTNYDPKPNIQIPAGLRFGNAIFKGQFAEFKAPALVPILNQGNLFIIARGTSKKKAIQALQSSLLRVIASFPPGKLKLILMDPIGLGANVAGFMNLPEQIIGNKAWTEPQHIEQRLADLSSYMENVIQKYLRNDYKTMEEYNQYAGEVAEPYRFLCVINFPANFTDASAKRLVSIASNGPRAGVYLIGTIDADLPFPYGFNLPDLLRTGSVIESLDTGDFIWRVPELEKLGLALDTPPATGLFNRIILPVGEIAKQGDRVEVPFEKIMPLKREWWKGDTSTDIRAPIGRRGARDIQIFELGQGIQHYGLMAGKPGSGKSTLLHVLITNLALSYPPEELILYLVDFKKGVEFKDYAEFRLPHARVVAIESEREFGLSVLKEVELEMNNRGDLFRKANYQELNTYREKTNHRLPRLFLIIDEFQRLFSEDDPLANQASNILAHIVQQGRAFGIHVLLSSQTLADAYAVGRATYDKMNVRIALQCTEADSRLILGEDNGAARLLSRPGEAVYNALNGREEGNSFFQVAWLPDEKRENYLRQIKDLAEKANYKPSTPQVIFEGNIPSKISGNTTLWNLFNNKGWPNFKDTVDIYLGESTEISPPHTLASFHSQGRSNLLIIGQDEQRAYSIVSSALLSLCANLDPDNISIFLADFSRSDDPWATIFPNIKSVVPHKISLIRHRDFSKLISQVDEIVKERIQNETRAPKVFLILIGLHRARELRDTDQYGTPGEVSQTLANICREGPDLGVHVITWCDTYGNFTRMLDRRSLSEFDIRIALQMGEDDSNQFIESPKAKSLGQNRAFLYDLNQIGKLEKFRPYELITSQELDYVQNAFSKKNFKRKE
jgi:DNA segregation ATPase FtsK/SpoIIIE, S-DNA-T family